MYDYTFCKCGHIIPVLTDDIEKAVTDDKLLGYICGNCGTLRYRGADKRNGSPDFNEPEEVYDMYGFAEDNVRFDINPDFFDRKNNPYNKDILKITYIKGIPVPMRTGCYANRYTAGKFYGDDVESSVGTCDVVNMNRFIRENDPDILKEISRYAIRGFDWKGTPYENHVK